MAVPGIRQALVPQDMHHQSVGAFCRDRASRHGRLIPAHETDGIAAQDACPLPGAVHSKHASQHGHAARAHPQAAHRRAVVAVGGAAIVVLGGFLQVFRRSHVDIAVCAEGIRHVFRMLEKNGGVGRVQREGRKHLRVHVALQALPAEKLHGAACQAAVQIGVLILFAGRCAEKIAFRLLLIAPAGIVAGAFPDGGGVAHHLTQGDGRILAKRIAHGLAVIRFKGRVKQKLSLLPQLHQPHGGDHFGHRGALEQGVFVRRTGTLRILKAAGIPIFFLALLPHQHNQRPGRQLII